MLVSILSMGLGVVLVGFLISLHRSHLLCVLLYFELITLILLFVWGATIKMGGSMILIVILTFGASEAALGLSLLVNMSRSFGSSMLGSLSLVGLWWGILMEDKSL